MMEPLSLRISKFFNFATCDIKCNGSNPSKKGNIDHKVDEIRDYL